MSQILLALYSSVVLVTETFLVEADADAVAVALARAIVVKSWLL